MNKCPVCDSTEVKIIDCGYTTFNRGHVECVCGFKINYKNLNSENDFKDNWNRDLDYINQIINLNEKDKNALLIALFVKDTFSTRAMVDKINNLISEGKES